MPVALISGWGGTPLAEGRALVANRRCIAFRVSKGWKCDSSWLLEVTTATRRPVDATFYTEGNLVKRFFSKIKNVRRIAARYDKLA